MAIIEPPGLNPGPTMARRIGWFVAIWAGSVAALGIVAYGLRWLLLP